MTTLWIILFCWKKWKKKWKIVKKQNNFNSKTLKILFIITKFDFKSFHCIYFIIETRNKCVKNVWKWENHSQIRRRWRKTAHFHASTAPKNDTRHSCENRLENARQMTRLTLFLIQWLTKFFDFFFFFIRYRFQSLNEF